MTLSPPQLSAPQVTLHGWPRLSRGNGLGSPRLDGRARLILPAGSLAQGWLHQVGVEAQAALARLRVRNHAVSCFIVSAPIAFVLSTATAFLTRFSLPTPSSLAEGMLWTWAAACVLSAWVRVAVAPLASGSLRSLRRRRRLETLLLVRRDRRGERSAAVIGAQRFNNAQRARLFELVS